ncbi:hypothetical protein ACHAW6_000243 [Cyclotella cf. meneghiniana]
MRLSTPTKVRPLPKDINGVPASGNINNPTVVGMLLYLCSHSFRDITFAIDQVSRYTFMPICHHELALVQIGHYHKGTKDEGLIMSPPPDPHIGYNPDADFAGLYGHKDSQNPHCA